MAKKSMTKTGPPPPVHPQLAGGRLSRGLPVHSESSTITTTVIGGKLASTQSFKSGP
jgi:hypothetical protein